MGQPPRYAAYFAPAQGSALWTFGSGIIGYDAYAGADVAFAPPVLAEVNAELNADWHPRRYGFHATLKAPMVLPEGRSEAELAAFAADFAARTPAFALDGLAVAELETNFALLPVGDVTRLNGFAFAVVQAFEPFRAPMTGAERARRLAGPITERQRDNVERFGYPSVGDDFWFHMTLTGPIAPARRPEIGAAIRAAYAGAGDGPVAIDNVTLYRQDDRARPFRIMARFALAGA